MSAVQSCHFVERTQLCPAPRPGPTPMFYQTPLLQVRLVGFWVGPGLTAGSTSTHAPFVRMKVSVPAQQHLASLTQVHSTTHGLEAL